MYAFTSPEWLVELKPLLCSATHNRGFNGTLHAGKIRSYIVLALAINHQALTQKSASSKKPQVENPKFAMRTWLNRMGLIGGEFKNCREHLIKHLEGSAAWRFRGPAGSFRQDRRRRTQILAVPAQEGRRVGAVGSFGELPEERQHRLYRRPRTEVGV